jgi:hypothetical protein
MRNPRANLPDADGWQTDRDSIPPRHGLVAWIARSVILIAAVSIAYQVW